MGFNLKMFFEELIKMLDEGKSIEDIKEFVESEHKYAKECNTI